MQEALAAYLFLLPFDLSLLIFFGYAFVRSVYFSFTDYNMFDPPNWVGLANYAAIFREPRFLIALRNSIGFRSSSPSPRPRSRPFGRRAQRAHPAASPFSGRRTTCPASRPAWS